MALIQGPMLPSVSHNIASAPLHVVVSDTSAGPPSISDTLNSPPPISTQLTSSLNREHLTSWLSSSFRSENLDWAKAFGVDLGDISEVSPNDLRRGIFHLSPVFSLFRSRNLFACAQWKSIWRCSCYLFSSPHFVHAQGKKQFFFYPVFLRLIWHLGCLYYFNIRVNNISVSIVALPGNMFMRQRFYSFDKGISSFRSMTISLHCCTTICNFMKWDFSSMSFDSEILIYVRIWIERPLRCSYVPPLKYTLEGHLFSAKFRIVLHDHNIITWLQLKFCHSIN